MRRFAEGLECDFFRAAVRLRLAEELVCEDFAAAELRGGWALATVSTTG